MSYTAQDFYPTDDVRQPKKTKKVHNPTKLRASITPGTVAIILAGRFRGKRVVVLKQLNDTVLVSGPFKINGVPLRRVNPAYLIATSTKLELPSSLSLDKFDVSYFARPKAAKGEKSEADLFAEKDQEAREESS
ncbi:hypothetical protein MRB53_040833 [Persea americana]|nr:hypothetical protein MRB53_040833 [Persea americana]